MMSPTRGNSMMHNPAASLFLGNQPAYMDTMN